MSAAPEHRTVSAPAGAGRGRRGATESIAAFYRAHPRMVSSPFGGIDGIDHDFLATVFDRLGIELTDRRVLDIGCGRGYVSAWVEAAGGSYTGLDLAPTGGEIRLALGDACALPFPDGSFDAVFCIDAFEHIPDPDRAAREMARVLTRDGFVFLSTPNYGNVAGAVKWWCETFGGYPKRTWAPFGRWQPQEWESPLTFGRVRRIFRRAGFTGIAVEPHGAEVGLGVCPWLDHPKTPEAVQFRLQGFFRRVGPAIARVCPTASLHGFWKISF